MDRCWSLLLALLVLPACGSGEDRPAPAGEVFSSSGGSGGSDAAAGTGGGTAGGTAGSAGNPSDGGVESGADGTDGGIACVEDPTPTSGQGYCVTIDGDGYECNPITSASCNVGAGETCAFDGERFRCMPEDFGLVGPCGRCGSPYPELCIPGFTCRGLGGKCSRYCCDDLQCAVGQACVMQVPTSLGICQATSDQILAGFVGEPPPADAGTDAGTGDSGPPGAEPVCNPPAAPGDGSCVSVGEPGYSCNPITNEGCDPGGGEACDLVAGQFTCVTGTHDMDICAHCTGASCKPGSTCIVPQFGCAKFCCTDAECTPGLCDHFDDSGGPGICVKPING